MRHRRLAATALTASALLAACGGGEGGSKEAFIAKGDAVCAENREKQRPIQERTIGPAFASGGTPTLVQWRALFEGIRPITAELFADFKTLEPPTADRARFDRWVAIEEDVQARMDATTAAAASGDQARFDTAMAALNAASEPLEADFKADGFKVCGAEEQ